MAAAVAFDGASALRWTQKVVTLGPRPVDTDAHRAAEKLIVEQAKRAGCLVKEDVWTAQTPLGPKRMNNIIARSRSGPPGSVVAITGHYDTKLMNDEVFVGANDAGSSTGLLLELTRSVCSRALNVNVWLVWFDGEEALRPQWAGEDNLYGSRRLAKRWSADGTLGRIKALINVDMIGDRNLALMEEMNSTAWLRNLIWRAANELGHARQFPRNPGYIEDDHVPFLRAGAPAVDLIDFDYGPDHSWWHTDRDTIDKLDARSFQVVGEVLLRVISKLEEK